jgi:O-methyltransferase involved in polyketide biosynthesis
MAQPDELAAQGGLDTSRPTAARMYDYYLGGANNFKADREAAKQVIARMPDAPLIAQANRAFLRRSVQFLAEHGIRQFLDIGSGIPTLGNVHEIAQHTAADARVVYVDIDPIAIAHAHHLLGDNSRATALIGDLTHPQELLARLDRPPAAGVLDLSQPVALLMTAVLPFAAGQAAHAAVTQLREALVPGSYLVISHTATGGRRQDEADAVVEVYQHTVTPGGPRTREEILAFFDGCELVEPGLVWLPQWRPEPGVPIPDEFREQPQRAWLLGGVARRL